jgi:hypothetical protein
MNTRSLRHLVDGAANVVNIFKQAPRSVQVRFAGQVADLVDRVGDLVPSAPALSLDQLADMDLQSFCQSLPPRQPWLTAGTWTGGHSDE